MDNVTETVQVRSSRQFQGIHRDSEQPQLVVEILAGRLEKLKTAALSHLERKHHSFAQLLESHELSLPAFLNLFGRVVAGLALGSALYLIAQQGFDTTVGPRAPPAQSTAQAQLEQTDRALAFRSLLATINHQPTSREEGQIAALVQDLLHVAVKSELEGMRLNTNYGYMGGEQHLRRYLGDTMATHLKNDEERSMFGDAGMAPALGAWGMWAKSGKDLTKENIAQEQWYVAIQTFLSPGWDAHYWEYYKWFQYRKVMVINPANGKGVVAVIGDAGPASWTGKVFGGSPEVMEALGLGSGSRKGAVVIFFVDDRQNSVPLGPVDIPKLSPIPDLAIRLPL